MASRYELEQRKMALYKVLRETYRDGTHSNRVPLPPVRELADRYQISVNVARQVVQSLVEEGVLHTVPRVGTFAGPPKSSASEFMLLLLPEDPDPRHYGTQIALGFESRIAQLGGASLVMSLSDALSCRRSEQMPPLVGVFDCASQFVGIQTWSPLEGIAHVTFGHSPQTESGPDQVSFDDVSGGAIATQHLVQMGHHRIAYLGLHVPDKPSNVFFWSAAREEGWRQAMAENSLSAQHLAYHPATEVEPNHTSQIHTAALLSRILVQRGEITAVVAANDFAAQGLFQALREAHVPPESWPAVVGFDNRASVHKYVVTSLHLPWNEIGEEAVNLLWERRTGHLTGPPVQRMVPLLLFPRLTSRVGWPRRVNTAMLVSSGI